MLHLSFQGDQYCIFMLWVERGGKKKGSLCKVTKQTSSKFEFSVFQGKYKSQNSS